MLTTCVMNHDTRRSVGSGAREIHSNRSLHRSDGVTTALAITAQGGKADIAKLLKGFGPGVMEIAARYRSDAWWVVYRDGNCQPVWVVRAFRKKSKTGAKTSKAETDLVRGRLARLRRELTP